MRVDLTKTEAMLAGVALQQCDEMQRRGREIAQQGMAILSEAVAAIAADRGLDLGQVRIIRDEQGAPVAIESVGDEHEAPVVEREDLEA